MALSVKITECVVIVLTGLVLQACSNVFSTLDRKYQLVNEAYSVAQSLFNQGRANYITLKERSLNTIDIFLDLVQTMNEEMARELRGAVVKFYKIKYFHDFTNYMISMDEMVDIIEHCLADPVEKLAQIRAQFRGVIQNFKDIRNFDTVATCHKELPDEVACAHCILHQAVLFNETMQESLVAIVEIKTRQHAQDMNSSLYNVQVCINDFIPKFFEQLLLDAYTNRSGFLRVVNASIADLIKDKWRGNITFFPEKWSPLVKLFKERDLFKELKIMPLPCELIYQVALFTYNNIDEFQRRGVNTARALRSNKLAHVLVTPAHKLRKSERTTTPERDPLYLTLLAGNLSSQDIVKTLY